MKNIKKNVQILQIYCIFRKYSFIFGFASFIIALGEFNVSRPVTHRVF